MYKNVKLTRLNVREVRYIAKVSVDGVFLDDIITITNVNYGLAPEIEQEFLNYKTRNGVRLKWSKYTKREINIDFVVIGDVTQKMDIVKRLMFSSGAKKFIFETIPDAYFSGIVSGSSFTLETFSYGKGSFTITCDDPFGYSTTVKQAVQSNNKLIFEHNGTAQSYPIFQFTASSNMKMFALTHPNRQAIQYGYDTGGVVILSGNTVKIDTADGSIYVNGQRKYINPASKVFHINPGRTEIGITVNSGATIPRITATFREAFI